MVFNVANILLVAAIDIAGMAVAFPVGIGLALVIGVVTTYMAKPEGDPGLLFIGVACVAAAIVRRCPGLPPIAVGRAEDHGQGDCACRCCAVC